MTITDVTQLEDLIISTARQLGVHPTALAMTQVALDLAGSEVIDGMIVVPGKGALKPDDYLKSLRSAMPSGFAPVAAPVEITVTKNLTDEMRREIAESRSNVLPAEWHAVRSRMKGLTAEIMDERASEVTL